MNPLADLHSDLDIVFTIDLVNQGGVYVMAFKCELPQQGSLANDIR